MLKPLLALLLVLAAFSGGIYAFHGSKGPKRPKTEDASRLLRRYQRYFWSSPIHPSEPDDPDPQFVSPHTVAVVAAGLVFVAAAYFGLGQTLQADAIPTTAGSMAMNEVSLHDDLRLTAGDSKEKLSKPVAGAEFAIPPGSVAEAPPLTAPNAAPPAEVVAATQEPTPVPTPEPVVEPYVPPVFAEGSMEAIICALPWPCEEAIGVAACESGLDRNGLLDGNWATNGNHYGLFQISYIHAWRWADFYDAWMDPTRNAQYAFEIWSESGWRPWSCRPY